MATSTPRSILVIGGTSAQGRHVVAELVRDKKYLVTILTRDPTSTIARSLYDLGNVTLLSGSYQSEDSLRQALKGQYGVYANLDGFAITEGEEYFWTFRLYDLAVQYGVQHFIYSSLYNRPKERLYDESYRASHMLTKGRIGEWLKAQPTSILPFTIIIGTLYAEMLSAFLRPDVDESGVFNFPNVTGDGHIQFVDVQQYGHYSRWIFDNPERSIGKEIALASYTTTTEGLAEAFTKVTGKPAISKTISREEWLATRAPPTFKHKMPLNVAHDPSDDSRFTFEHTFVGFWNIWSRLTPQDAAILPGRELADEIYPDRIKSIEEWILRTGYTGEKKNALKAEETATMSLR
ncbi:hypothetical protein C8J56DRAFT_1167625 [Mycena floridula]|nr:hypothetical protein C8J56DRAFT_1167625 [Mycena floridula]